MTTRPTTALHAAADAALIALFLALLWLPSADQVLGLDPSPPLDEKRELAKRPRVPTSAEELAALPGRCEAWFDDHFGFRNAFLRLHSLATIRAFGVSPTPRVTIGEDGWLFMDTEVQFHRADRPYSEQDLAAWQRVLEARRDWLARRGCRYLLVIAPNKSTIYPELLPRSARQIGKTTRLDQLALHMRQHSNVELLDLRQALLQAKGSEPLFFRTDTHWNSLGGLVAYREIVKTLGRCFPRLEPLPRSAFHVYAKPANAGDLALMLGAESLFEDTRIVVQRNSRPRAVKRGVELPGNLWDLPLPGHTFATEAADPSLPRAVMFCDSFSTYLAGFLSEHFSRIVYFRATVEADPQTAFEPALVEAEQPQLVISEFVERFLAAPPPPDPHVGLPPR